MVSGLLREAPRADPQKCSEYTFDGAADFVEVPRGIPPTHSTFMRVASKA
jgi:hypothetical protein